MKDKLKLAGIFLAAVMLMSLASCVTITKNPTGAAVADDSDFTDIDLDEDEIDGTLDDIDSMADDSSDDASDDDSSSDDSSDADDSADEVDSSLPKKTVTEGELVSFPNLRAVDPDGDTITYTFSEPLNADGEWDTSVGDAGNYKVTITASDGVNTVSQDVMIVVLSANKAPVISVSDVTVKEGETVNLDAKAEDPENGEVDVEFSGWMTSSSKETSYADAGVYSVKVTATDGERESEKTITVTVLNVNREPVLSVSDVTVVEGDTAEASAAASDPDGDDVSVSFSEPLDADGEWATEVGDAGKYRVTATADDGEDEVTKSFFVIVTPQNIAPELSGVTDIEADEGDTIQLSISASDEDGDEVEIAYPAPFDATGRWATGYEDAGIYTLTVAATDGISNTEESFTVVVNDLNRAPTFGEGAFD